MSSQLTENKEYIKFLKFLLSTKKDKKNTHQLLQNISEDSVQKICRCFFNLINHGEIGKICYKKNKKNAKKLEELINKHRDQINMLTRHSTRKKEIEKKRKVIQGKGIFTTLALAIPRSDQNSFL